MIERSGRQNGTREMISLLHLGQRTGSDQLTRAITQAVELGCAEVPQFVICLPRHKYASSRTSSISAHWRGMSAHYQPSKRRNLLRSEVAR